MKKNISFVTTASGKIGLGHVVRSISLAQMLDHQFNISFIIATDSSSVTDMVRLLKYSVIQLPKEQKIDDAAHILPLLDNVDIIVLDFYGLTTEFQTAIKASNIKVVCIDDLHQIYFYADVIINASNGVSHLNYKCENYTQLLLGTNYALLRPAFLQSARKKARSFNNINSVFISMGGADEPNNTLRFLKAIAGIEQIKQLHIIVGVVNKHKQLIIDFVDSIQTDAKIIIHSNIDSVQINQVAFECQLAICPASGTSAELCTIGIGLLTGYTADNQKDLLKGIIANNCALNLGDINLLNERDITNAVLGLINDVARVNEMIICQKKLIDGKSDNRIRKVFELL